MATNSWPGGVRRALNQSQHEALNASHYPGTRQICVECETPTERCEEEALYAGDLGPLCDDCYRVTVQPGEGEDDKGGRPLPLPETGS